MIGGALKIGGVMDLVSKPVMTGFLFGLGLTVAIGQLPKLFGVETRRRKPHLVALGGSNVLAGFSSGFVQSGGGSQTLAGER